MENLIIITVVFTILCFILISRMKKKEPPKSTSDLEDYYMDMATPTTKEYVDDQIGNCECPHFSWDLVDDLRTWVSVQNPDLLSAMPKNKILSTLEELVESETDYGLQTLLLVELEYRKSEGLYEEETEEIN